MFWGDLEYPVNASKYYMNNLRSYNCTDCDDQYSYSSAILQKDGNWKVVDENYTSTAVLCMGFNHIESIANLEGFLLYVVLQVMDFEIVTAEEPMFWSDTAEVCAQNFGHSLPAPVTTPDLQRKV